MGDKLKKEAENNSKEDENQRNLIDSRNKLESSIFSLEKNVKDKSDFMKKEQIKEISDIIKEAKILINSNSVDIDKIKSISISLDNKLDFIKNIKKRILTKILRKLKIKMIL